MEASVEVPAKVVELEEVPPARVGGIRARPRGEEARERLFRLGAAALSEQELLALLLDGQPRLPTGSAAPVGSLKALLQCDASQLASVPGLGARRAARLLCAVELGRRALSCSDPRPRLRTPEEIYKHLRPRLALLRKEEFHVLCLNSRNALLREGRVAEGSVNACPVDPREVFAPALCCGATAVVLAHNHPSGDPEPSEMDLELTRTLDAGGRFLGIRVLDHLILGDGAFTSLFARGLMPRQER